MTRVDMFGPPDGDRPGFRTVSGAPAGLQRLLLAVGRLPAGDHGPDHLHEGEEILHVLSGRLRVRVGERLLDAGPGSVLAVPAGVVHGFDVVEDALLEVVAEQQIGTFYRVRDHTGATQLVEVHRADMPWGRPPRPGYGWTTDAELQEILRHLDHGCRAAARHSPIRPTAPRDERAEARRLRSRGVTTTIEVGAHVPPGVQEGVGRRRGFAGVGGVGSFRGG